MPVVLTASMSEVIAESVAPVLQIMLGIHELCRKPSSPLSMVVPKVGLLGISMPSPLLLEPSQPLVFVDNRGLDATILHSRVTIDQQVSVGGEVGGQMR